MDIKENLRDEFSEKFFEEHIRKALFHKIFSTLERGCSPYLIIEQLCIMHDEINSKMDEIIQNKPMKVIVTTEQFDNLTTSERSK